MGPASDVFRKSLKNQETLASIFLLLEYNGYWLFGYGTVYQAKKFGLRIWICCDTQECCNVESSKTTKNIFLGGIAYWKLVLKINIAKFDVAYIDVTISFVSCFLLNGCFDTKHACFPPESMQGTIKICL